MAYFDFIFSLDGTLLSYHIFLVQHFLWHLQSSFTSPAQKPGLNVTLCFFNRVKYDSESDTEETESHTSEESFAKPKKAKKRAGRKGQWATVELDDFIDIIVNNESYKEKLIFRNTKNMQNGVVYEKVLNELKERCSERGDEFDFSVAQLRTKFKKCVADCKKAALTIKTATGIKRFQEEKGYGSWFQQLFALVKTRDSCQPEQAIEPSAETTSQPPDVDDDGNEMGTKVYVPIRSKSKEKKKESNDLLLEAVQCMRSMIENDPMKDLVNLMREEMRSSREHELRLYQLMFNSQNTGRNNQQYDASGLSLNANINQQTATLPSANNASFMHGFMGELNSFNSPYQEYQSAKNVNQSNSPNTYQTL